MNSDWLNLKNGNLWIANEFYHHHAFEIINTHNELKKNIYSILNNEIPISPRTKVSGQKKSEAIKADELNSEIRNLFQINKKKELRFEVNEEGGVFYFSSEKSAIGGFDFAFINHEKNIIALRNLCFGELQYFDGIKRWNQFIGKNPDLKEYIDNIITIDNIGKNLKYTKKPNDSPLIVGEIQFGNWALAYRDFFKVLKANVQNSVDCLIYIVPTGKLESMLSDGIVTFEKTVKILNEFEKVISVPIWVIGIDLKFEN